MPVKRYDNLNLEEAERDLWLDSSDPALARCIREVWSFAERFSEPARPGVVRVYTGGPLDAGAGRTET